MKTDLTLFNQLFSNVTHRAHCVNIARELAAAQTQAEKKALWKLFKEL